LIEEVAMSDQRREPQQTATLLGEISDTLKALGFDPGIPVYDLSKVEFGPDRVKEALFQSTLHRPVLLHFSEDDADPSTPLGVDLSMVVESVQVYYAPREPRLDGKPIGCWEDPEFYLRGFAYKSGFDPYPEVIRMHVYLRVASGSGFDGATLQIVREPSGADPSTPLAYGSQGIMLPA
jgi:hypothetical protein